MNKQKIEIFKELLGYNLAVEKLSQEQYAVNDGVLRIAPGGSLHWIITPNKQALDIFQGCLMAALYSDEQTPFISAECSEEYYTQIVDNWY
jgi:hypothetical protein